MMKQVDAVVNAVCAVLNQDSFDEAVKLSKDEKKQVIEIVTQGLANGEVSFSDKAKARYSSEELIRSKYAPGLVDNHLRKCKRLNGNINYETKNPGSRAGAGDAQLKEMKKLRRTLTESAEIELVDQAINERIAELKAEKAQDVEIDRSVLPEALQSIGQ